MRYRRRAVTARCVWALALVACFTGPAPSGAQTGDSIAPAAPDDGGPRHWEVKAVSQGLNLREQPSTQSAIVRSYQSGTILANLGCQEAEGRVWCDVQQLGGGARGFVSAKYLQPATAPDGSVPTGPDDSALRAGQRNFDATGKIPCAQVRGQPMTLCEFGVARAGGGYATVIVTKPDGVGRAIYFVRGQSLGADTSQADGYPPVAGQKENDLHLISIGEERYEVPDAVIFGG